jgi:hypothetical protein
MRIYAIGAALIAVFLSACASSNPSPTATVAIATRDTAANGSSDQSATEYGGPEWTKLPLTNAHTGETFTLANFAGKTVYIEPMATW